MNLSEAIERVRSGLVEQGLTGGEIEKAFEIVASSASRFARGITVALSYPRGSEAQVRCLEEVGQEAEHVLKKGGAA